MIFFYVVSLLYKQIWEKVADHTNEDILKLHIPDYVMANDHVKSAIK